YHKLSLEHRKLNKEINELKKSVAESKSELANAREQFQHLTNEKVLNIFETTHQLQTELILLEQKYYVLNDEKLVLQRSIKELKHKTNFAEQLRQKITVVNKYILNDYCTEIQTESADNHQSIGLKILEAQEHEKRR